MCLDFIFSAPFLWWCLLWRFSHIPILLRTFITFYRSTSSPSRTHTYTPCKVKTLAEDVLIWCVVLQGQHVHSQYWTGDAQWHSAKVNVATKYNPSLNKKHSSTGTHSSEELAGLHVPSAGLFCSSHIYFSTLAAFDSGTIINLTGVEFRDSEKAHCQNDA